MVMAMETFRAFAGSDVGAGASRRQSAASDVLESDFSFNATVGSSSLLPASPHGGSVSDASKSSERNDGTRCEAAAAAVIDDAVQVPHAVSDATRGDRTSPP